MLRHGHRAEGKQASHSARQIICCGGRLGCRCRNGPTEHRGGGEHTPERLVGDDANGAGGRPHQPDNLNIDASTCLPRYQGGPPLGATARAVNRLTHGLGGGVVRSQPQTFPEVCGWGRHVAPILPRWPATARTYGRRGTCSEKTQKTIRPSELFITQMEVRPSEKAHPSRRRRQCNRRGAGAGNRRGQRIAERYRPDI